MTENSYGHGFNGKRAWFQLPSGESFSVRAIPEWDAQKFLTTQTLAALGSLAMVICLFGNSGPLLTKDFLTGFAAVGMLFMVAATAAAVRHGKTLPWKEGVVFFLSYGLLRDAHMHGLASVWRDPQLLLMIAGLVLIIGWYVYYIIDRLVWEPLASMLIFLGVVIAVALGLSLRGAMFLYGGTMIVHFVLLMTVAESSFGYERGYRSIPYD